VTFQVDRTCRQIAIGRGWLSSTWKSKKVQHEMYEKEAKGRPTVDLEKRLEELESQKHELVERIEALWSA